MDDLTRQIVNKLLDIAERATNMAEKIMNESDELDLRDYVTHEPIEPRYYTDN